MIWVLLFAVIFGSSSNNVFMLPSFNKAVKEYIETKEDKKEILTLLDQAKEKRKPILKEGEQNRKALDEIFKNRTTTKAQFDSLFIIAIKNKTALRKVNLNTLMEAQKYINEEEWEFIIKKNAIDAENFVEKSEKLVKVADKYFNRIDKVLKKDIADVTKQDQAIKNVYDFETSLLNGYKNLVIIASDKNALIYKYNITEEDIDKIDLVVSKETQKVYDKYAALHAQIVSLTTEEEWKKINKDLAFPR